MKKNFFYSLMFFTASFLVSCQSAENANGTLIEEEPITETLVEELAYTPDADIQNFYDNELSEKLVLVNAVVIKNLADDNKGSRHQKFLIELESGQTLLVSHNIDLANRIEDLYEGDEVKISGQYEWNDRGGVIHWTHHDPDGVHTGGWIEHENKRYE